jgi:hypothetical protein
LAQRGSRKRRKQRQRRDGSQDHSAPSTADAGQQAGPEGAMARGYARGRIKDEEARAALKPLTAGERPTAVTVGAVVAAVAAVANVVALIAGYDADEGAKTAQTVLGAGILTLVAVGMWRARYWAVLGMQTLLAITIILGSLALLTAVNVQAAVLIVAIVVAAGTLFWFLIKAMARIQMPARPGADSQR